MAHPHVLHTIWLDSREPGNTDTLWIKPLPKGQYGAFVYGQNGWIMTTALFKGTLGEFVVNDLPEATEDSNGVMSYIDKRILDSLDLETVRLGDLVKNIFEKKVNYLKDKDGYIIFPVTHEDAVIDTQGKTLTEKLSGKQDTLKSGENIKTINNQSVLGEGNIEIKLNVQPDWNQNDSSAGDYVKNRTHWDNNGEVHKLDTKFLDLDSEPTVGSGNPVTSGGVASAIADFITRSVNDLANYYLKSETYTKEEVNSLIGTIQHFHYEIYPNLESVTHLANNILYLIGPTGSGTDKYEEYVYDSTKTNPWVKIGDTSIDLTGYVTTEALNTALASYVTSTALTTALAAKQDTLVSGTNIKTINNQSILGGGNITIESSSSVQSDWEEDDTTDPAFIKNKPDLASKQDTLVSGTNIKTINNQSLLGSGNITIEGGGGGGTSPVSVIDTINGDFELQDESGNVLLRLADGHIQTKEFNSSDFSVEEKKPLRILFFGNSLTQDAVAYLPLVLQEVAPEIDFEIYLWYNGGINLTTQYSTYLQSPTTNCGIFSIFKSSDEKWTNYSNSKSINWVIANCDFDILCLQEYGNNGQSDSQIITAFDNISDWFATNYDKPLKIVSLMDAPARGDVSGVTTRIEHYNQVFYQNCPSEGMIPAGLAMSYACQDATLNQLGDSGGLSPDGVHAQEGLPCLLQSYVVAMWLFREMGITKSIWGSKLRITTAIYTALDVPGANLGTGVITGTDAENILAQRCAIKAIKRGRELEVLTTNS